MEHKKSAFCFLHERSMGSSLSRPNRKEEDYEFRRRKPFCATFSKKNHRLWIKSHCSLIETYKGISEV